MKDITIGRASHTRRARDSIARCLGLKDDDAQCGGLAGYLMAQRLRTRGAFRFESLHD
jgi:hypothetical protein